MSARASDQVSQILVSYLSVAVVMAIAAYPAMLALGDWHAHWASVPAFGFLAVYVTLLAFRLVWIVCLSNWNK